MPTDTEESNDQKLNEELRTDISDAYAVLEGQRVADSFGAMTLEDCMDSLLEQITGVSTTARPNALDKVTAIEQRVQNAIAKIQGLPADTFRSPEATQDVNPPDEYDPAEDDQPETL